MAPTGPWREDVAANLAPGNAVTDAHPDGHQEERERIEGVEAGKLASPGKPSTTQLLLLMPDGSTTTAPYGGSTGGLTVFIDPDTDEPFIDEALVDPLPPPPPDSNPQPPTPPQPGAPTYPADVFDLRPWKITLPIDTTHAGGPDEVKTPELLTFPDPSATADAFNTAARKYFYVRTNADGSNCVVFMAPIDGAATSGSAYPRSELREMNLDGTNASWSTTDGKTHTLRWTIAFEKTPKSKPQIVGGQIHDGSQDRIEILRDDSVAATPTLTYRLNGSTQATRLLTNYTAGAYVDMMIVVGPTSGSVKLYCQNMTTPVVILTGQSWSGCYFKAGDYTQANKTNATLGELGQTSIKSLTVTHV